MACWRSALAAHVDVLGRRRVAGQRSLELEQRVDQRRDHLLAARARDAIGIAAHAHDVRRADVPTRGRLERQYFVLLIERDTELGQRLAAHRIEHEQIVGHFDRGRVERSGDGRLGRCQRRESVEALEVLVELALSHRQLGLVLTRRRIDRHRRVFRHAGHVDAGETEIDEARLGIDDERRRLIRQRWLTRRVE
jgi:hypothetical protein